MASLTTPSMSAVTSMPPTASSSAHVRCASVVFSSPANVQSSPTPASAAQNTVPASAPGLAAKRAAEPEATISAVRDSSISGLLKALSLKNWSSRYDNACSSVCADPPPAAPTGTLAAYASAAAGAAASATANSAASARAVTLAASDSPPGAKSDGGEGGEGLEAA